MDNLKLMETLVVKIKSEQAAQQLADFLKTIDYVEAVEQSDSDISAIPHAPINGMVRGDYARGEKPSDFAGIWKSRKKLDAKKLRQRAWQRKK